MARRRFDRVPGNHNLRVHPFPVSPHSPLFSPPCPNFRFHCFFSPSVISIFCLCGYFLATTRHVFRPIGPRDLSSASSNLYFPFFFSVPFSFAWQVSTRVSAFSLPTFDLGGNYNPVFVPYVMVGPFPRPLRRLPFSLRLTYPPSARCFSSSPPPPKKAVSFLAPVNSLGLWRYLRIVCLLSLFPVASLKYRLFFFSLLLALRSSQYRFRLCPSSAAPYFRAVFSPLFCSRVSFQQSKKRFFFLFANILRVPLDCPVWFSLPLFDLLKAQ